MRVAYYAAALMVTSIAVAQERAPGEAAAEPKKKPADASSAALAGPDSTTETFGDWSLVCSASAGGAGERACEVNTSIVLRGQSAPFARIAFTRAAKDRPTRVIALVPVNISTQSVVRIANDTGKSEISLPFKSCVPGGCLAEADLAKEQLLALRASTKAAAQLMLVDASGKSSSLPLSLRGLDQALNAFFGQQEK
jgi:invasion protein IalB